MSSLVSVSFDGLIALPIDERHLFKPWLDDLKVIEVKENFKVQISNFAPERKNTCLC